MPDCLIVDDSSTVRKIIRRIVQDFAFTCREAENGIEALKQCEQNMPDVILLDWNMPQMNGPEFLKNLRAKENGEKPKVIFCTTENSMNFIMEGMNAGADEYIMKPFDKDIIKSKLSQLGLVE